MNRKSVRSAGLDRYRVYEPPPKGFDPQTASQSLLRRHGIPRRPDPDKDPELAEQWRRVFSRPLRFIKAELAVDEVMSRRDPLRRADPNFGTANWGGAVFNSGTPVAWVIGNFVVPEVVANGPEFEAWGVETLTTAFWVGIDGYAGDPPQVLQAGVRADAIHAQIAVPGFESLSETVYAVWTEWYTDEYKTPPATVVNFPVEPGQTVSFLVCAPQPDFGIAFMWNETTDHATAVGIPAPGDDIRVAGRSAEWIVEKVDDKLPYFRPITFNGCQAYRPGRDLVDLGSDSSFTVTVAGENGDLTDAEITTSSSVLVRWEGYA